LLVELYYITKSEAEIVELSMTDAQATTATATAVAQTQLSIYKCYMATAAAMAGCCCCHPHDAIATISLLPTSVMTASRGPPNVRCVAS